MKNMLKFSLAGIAAAGIGCAALPLFGADAGAPEGKINPGGLDSIAMTMDEQAFSIQSVAAATTNSLNGSLPLHGSISQEIWSRDMRPAGFLVEDIPAFRSVLKLSLGHASMCVWTDYTEKGFREVDTTLFYGGTLATNLLGGTASWSIRGDAWAYPTDKLSKGRITDYLAGGEMKYSFKGLDISVLGLEVFPNRNHSEGTLFDIGASYAFAIGKVLGWQVTAQPRFDWLIERQYYSVGERDGTAVLQEGVGLTAERANKFLYLNYYHQDSFHTDKPTTHIFGGGAGVKF